MYTPVNKGRQVRPRKHDAEYLLWPRSSTFAKATADMLSAVVAYGTGKFSVSASTFVRTS